ncbi:hypothetical protein [Shewanella algae]|uniref:hypothetical protein n=1 Tax=Shewanella algae TaxID=38313 RepID=UPI001AAD70BE|nr:hypothetical protein [Shewanella algae]MBO2650492.1 hypothetical protein [Shewanella algae]MBO2701517.1 hypothetical protein [Shewanella algae]HDS1198309.1 hypothetical protein [Shewanella algae]
MRNRTLDKPISFSPEDSVSGMGYEPKALDALDCMVLARELSGRESIESQKNDYLFQSISQDWFDFKIIEDILLTVEKVIRLNRGGTKTSLPWLLPRNSGGDTFIDDRNKFLLQELERRGFRVSFTIRNGSIVEDDNASLEIEWG